jgi:hypothetical protein
VRNAAIVFVAGLALAAVASSQVEWNEMPLADGVFREYTTDYRTDAIDIPLGPLEELEYKLGLNEGDSIVYQWDAVDLKDPEKLYAEFHGHTPPVDNVGDLMFYRKATGATERGTLVAPFTGIHGWYLRNDTEAPIVVRLKVAGFYELLPP